MNQRSDLYIEWTKIADPAWDHPAIAHERGLSDASRGLPKRAGQGDDYARGYRSWSLGKKDHPLRHRFENPASR